MGTKILIASGNPGKIREFRALLRRLPLELVTLNDLNIRADIEETGRTYKENAALKARAYAKLSRLPALCDDSGLEVAALDGAPGLHSARYLGRPGASDADRRKYLLTQLEGHPRPWKAQFCCVVAVVFPDGEELFAEGYCPGEIIPVERGSNGFGYDPIFQLPSGKTMAELSDDIKNRVSHRALAVREALPLLLSKMGLS